MLGVAHNDKDNQLFKTSANAVSQSLWLPKLRPLISDKSDSNITTDKLATYERNIYYTTIIYVALYT